MTNALGRRIYVLQKSHGVIYGVIKKVDVLKNQGVVGCYLNVGHKEGQFFHHEAAEMSDFQPININTRD